MINAPDPNDIGFVTSTTQGIIDIAFSIRWKAGEGIVLLRGEFPANVATWLQAAKKYALKIHWLDADELVDPAVKENIITDEERPRSCSGKAHKGRVDFTVGAGMQYLNL